MKTPARQLLPLAALAFSLTLPFAVAAQDKPAPAPADQSAAVAPAGAPAQPAPAADSAKPELRRLDVAPAEPAAAPAPAADKAATASDARPPDDSGQAVAPAPPASTPAPESTPPAESRSERRGRPDGSHRGNGAARVALFHDSTLAAGEYADAVVSVKGSSTSAGTVGDAVVSVFGSSTSSGEVGNAVVSVLGDSRVTGGRVGDAVVSVLGNTYVNGQVKGDAVAVLGDVELGPDAEVNGDVVCVGGGVTRDPGAIVHGQVNIVAIGGHVGSFNWLHAWVTQCLFHARLLGFGAHLMWAWWFALGLLALYVVIALLFPRGVERCAETFEQRPGYSMLSAFLVTLVAPLAAILLIITIVGAPALIFCLFVAGLFGKAVMLAWIGRRITKPFGPGPMAAPAVAVLIGGVLVLLLYTVPVVAFIVAKLLSWLGLGVVVYTLILAMKRNKAAARAAAAAVAPRPASPPPVMPVAASPVESVATMGVAVDPAVPVSVPAAPPAAPADGPAPAPAAATPPVAPRPAPLPQPVLVSAATLPRAGFWIRLAASALDAVLVAVAIHLLPHVVRPSYLLVFAAYCVVLWALKGTTVGGIVCELKVVRTDDRPMDWPTALVRALGGFLSFVVAGLGFIWVAFDDQKQSWHDKIAGTTVVQVPKGVGLL